MAADSKMSRKRRRGRGRRRGKRMGEEKKNKSLPRLVAGLSLAGSCESVAPSAGPQDPVAAFGRQPRGQQWVALQMGGH